MRFEFFDAEDVRHLAADLIDELGLNHVDSRRLVCFRSRGSKSQGTVARIYSLSRIWQKALNLPPHYLMEVISERYDKLDEDEKQKIIIHELLHIPQTFRGGFRHHRGYVTNRRVEQLFKQLAEKRRITKSNKSDFENK
ncbi:MAG: putative metallopeptidase [Candidatus Bathyarchaeia archaeon]